MRIDSHLSFPAGQQPERVDPSASSPAHGRAEATAVVRDEARLTVDRDRITELAAKLSRLPEIRQDRVEALQRAVREGRYQISSEQIAEAVFSELLGQSVL